MAKRRSRITITPEALLADYPLEIRDTADQLRLLVKQTIPAVREVAYPGWRGIGYHHPQRGYFCAIFPQENGVRLAFEHGVDLPDPDNLLEGNGKQVRYVTIQGNIPQENIRRLLLIASGEQR